MTISFNQIPIAIRTPGHFIEFDNTRAVQGLVLFGGVQVSTPVVHELCQRILERPMHHTPRQEGWLAAGEGQKTNLASTYLIWLSPSQRGTPVNFSGNCRMTPKLMKPAISRARS